MGEEVIIKSDDIEYSEHYVSDVLVSDFRAGVLIKTNSRKSDTTYLTKKQVIDLYNYIVSK